MLSEAKNMLDFIGQLIFLYLKKKYFCILKYPHQL